MDPIRILLVDDQDVIRIGLKTFLNTRSGFRVVAEAENCDSAVQLALELKPDVVIMDISMSCGGGLKATQEIKAKWPECKVLALTTDADRQDFFAMISAGAVGYVTRQAAAEEIMTAVRAVAQGNMYVPPRLISWLVEEYLRLQSAVPGRVSGAGLGEPGIRLEALSKRERQVLAAVAEGLSTAQIAAMLDISPKTVARHRDRILHKLNLHSSLELVKYAIRTGLITIV